ncbi:MAG: STAS domain-containing protein [Leptospirales bacterium]|nr:STAS domain-containing protein [Leptospirales bacterium]
MSDTLNYTVTEYEGVKLLEVVGYISANTDVEFADFLETITDTDNVIIDMKSVVLLTSAGLESLVMISQNARKKDKRVVLVCVKPEVKDMFSSLSMYRFVIFADTIEDGLMKIQYYT